MSTPNFVGNGIAPHAARVALVRMLRDQVTELGGSIPQQITNLLEAQTIIRGRLIKTAYGDVTANHANPYKWSDGILRGERSQLFG